MLEQADGKAAQERGVFGVVTGSDAAVVFVPGVVQDVVAAVLDAPMAAVGAQHVSRAGPLGVELSGQRRLPCRVCQMALRQQRISGDDPPSVHRVAPALRTAHLSEAAEKRSSATQVSPY